MMKTFLANKYERMGAVPHIDAHGECVWCHVEDLAACVNRAVILDSEYEKCTDDVHALQRAHAHIGNMLSAEDDAGQTLPLWKVVLLSPTTALIRIDHCICDGLCAVTLLKEVAGIKTSSNMPLELSDLSPILRAIDKAGDVRIALLPLKLLWLPNLVRAIRFLVSCLSLGKELPNPLRPLTGDFGAVIPNENYGTVYFPTMPVHLFKDMAGSMGSGTTINDILLLCLSFTFGRYMDALKEQGHRDIGIGKVKVLLPVANPLRPSQYGNYYDGLCNRMTPVIVPLSIPRQNNEAESFTPTDAIKEIRAYMKKVKRSNTPLFMTVMNTILAPWLSLEKLKEAAKHSFASVSCVYSTVPGPTESISLQTYLTRSYKINSIQTVLPHHVSIFQTLSYNNNMFFNITLDTRAAAKPWILRTAFIEAVNSVADTTGVKSKWEKELARFETSTEWGAKELSTLVGDRQSQRTWASRLRRAT